MSSTKNKVKPQQIVIDGDDIVILAATRYALGRASYVVSDVVNFLLNNWNEISERNKNIILRDVKEAINQNLAGMECDVVQWSKILELGVE